MKFLTIFFSGFIALSFGQYPYDPDRLFNTEEGHAGVKAKLTYTGLVYLKDVATRILNKELPKIRLREFSTTGPFGKGQVHLRDVHVKTYKPPERTNLNIRPADNGLEIAIEDFDVTVGANFAAQRGGFKPEGTVDAVARGVTVVLIASMDGRPGRPVIVARSCKASIKDTPLNLRVGGGLIQKYLDDNKKGIERTVRTQLAEEVCSLTSKLLVRSLNLMMKEAAIEIPVNFAPQGGANLQGQFMERIQENLILDNTIVKPPRLTQDFLETYHKGEMRYKNSPRVTPFEPREIIDYPPAGPPKMVYITAGDYVLQSFLYHAYTLGKLNVKLSGGGILSTSCGPTVDHVIPPPPTGLEGFPIILEDQFRKDPLQGLNGFVVIPPRSSSGAGVRRRPTETGRFPAPAFPEDSGQPQPSTSETGDEGIPDFTNFPNEGFSGNIEDLTNQAIQSRPFYGIRQRNRRRRTKRQLLRRRGVRRRQRVPRRRRIRVEPQSLPIRVEPQSPPFRVEPQSPPFRVEPQSAPFRVEPQSPPEWIDIGYKIQDVPQSVPAPPEVHSHNPAQQAIPHEHHPDNPEILIFPSPAPPPVSRDVGPRSDSVSRRGPIPRFLREGERSPGARRGVRRGPPEFGGPAAPIITVPSSVTNNLCLGSLVPPIANEFPNQEGEMLFLPHGYPEFKMTDKGANIRANAKLMYLVERDGRKVPILTTRLYMDVDADVRLQDESRIVGNVTINRLEMRPHSSSLKAFDPSIVYSLGRVIKNILSPQINRIFATGMEIPLGNFVEFSRPTLDVRNGHVVFATDFKIDEARVQELVGETLQEGAETFTSG